jgi:hypothetical protein
MMKLAMATLLLIAVLAPARAEDCRLGHPEGSCSTPGNDEELMLMKAIRETMAKLKHDAEEEEVACLMWFSDTPDARECVEEFERKLDRIGR